METQRATSVGKLKVALVIQNAWDSSVLTMPLALGYLKAYAEADRDIARATDIRIYNYQRKTSVSTMAADLFRDPPDVLGFSVLGWNFNNFGRLSETYRLVNPDGWCVFGGNHASHQAERIFRLFPGVDFVVNGEGEITFYELLLARLAGAKRDACGDIDGLSFRASDGTLVTTPERPRLKNLDVIPSPLLTGAIPLFDRAGRFLYDVALMETNRGCPYSCAFCYWGGATGQKILAFSRERLREELEYLGRNRVEHLALCDSNFGMLAADQEFVEDLVRVRRDFGYPTDFVTSWAKNKSKVFYSIVKRLKETGLHSSFTLSLQTLSPEALEHMRRKNMKLNDFEEVCEWLTANDMSTDVELIWGAPGETKESFLAGYDRIAKHVPHIATYPLLLLPNTDYAEKKDFYGMVTVRDGSSDFEFVLSHSTLSLDANREMHRFLFWARVLAEHRVLRFAFTAARVFADLPQSELLRDVDDWFQSRTDPASLGLLEELSGVVENYDITRVTNAVAYTYLNEAALGRVFEAWWRERVVVRARPECRELLSELFRYDWSSRPYHDDSALAAGARTERVGDEEYWVREDLPFSFDVVKLSSALARNRPPVIAAAPTPTLTLYFRKGFSAVVANHEFASLYAGRPLDEVTRDSGASHSQPQRHVAGFDNQTRTASVPGLLGTWDE